MSQTRLERLATLAYTVEAGDQEPGKGVGHTLLQKLFYLLQYGEGVELGYKFKLHHYGPYCSEIWSDLNYLASQNVIDVRAKANGYGYDISPRKGSNSKFLIAELEGDIKEKVSNLLKLLGHNPVEELEAMATLHYIYHDFKKKGKIASNDMVINCVRELKPHLNREQLEASWERLQRSKLVSA